MKKIIVLSLAILFSLSAFTQEWSTDINLAKKQAKAEGKAIVLSFQGSDWCAPCIKLDHEIFSNPEFTAFAKDNYVMVKVDFPRKKKNRLSKEQQAKNGLLAEKYNPRGYFPHVVVLNANGEVKGELGYKDISVKEYIKLIEAFLN